ncbi:hypothetical protein GpartN1_g7752.t1 [Galdieria partita]|uniref:Uncharacterized protein n=1 Tax=Galdieria partita TaxID=83374 RepID=A0A9C7Q767_9RHOD|nr:hypothetical protein GpartN1_g7752.t1 [Galdieria partita]
MEYLGPNRRGRPGKSFGGRPRRVAQASNRSARKESALWDNSERFIEDASAENEEFFSLDLESSSSSKLAHTTVSQEYLADEQDFSFIEKCEYSLGALSCEEIFREALNPTTSDSSNFRRRVHLLDIEFDKETFSVPVRKDGKVEEASEQKLSDVTLLSSASNEAFDDWFDKLKLN